MNSSPGEDAQLPEPAVNPVHTLRERLILLATVVVLAASIALLGLRLQVTTDLGVFMPQGRSAAERLLLSQLDQGATSSLIFLSLSNESPEQLAAVNKSLAAEFRNDVVFQRVYNGELSISDEDKEFIIAHRYLLTPEPLAAKFTPTGMKQALKDRLDGLASATASFEKRYLRQDPTGELMALFDQWQNKQARREAGPQTLFGVWFSRDQKRSLMVIELASGGLDLALRLKAVDSINAAFAASDHGSAKMTLSGPSVYTVETRDTIRADVRILTTMALVMVGAFLLAAFRSTALLALVVLPLACSVIVAMAAVVLLFGGIHGITLAFGVTLTGVAIDYPIHVFTHLDSDRMHVRQHVRRIWPTLRLGVVTTVLAYAVFVLSEFEGLRQLGVFTMVGLLTAAIVTRWVLPVVVPNRLPLKQGLDGVHRLLEKMGRGASQLRIPTILVLLLATGFLFTTNKPLRNLDVDSLSPIASERRALGYQMRDDLGFWSGGQLLMVAASTPEQALQISEQLRAHLDQLVQEGAIADYDMAAQFLPSRAYQQQQQQALPAADELRDLLVQAGEGLPFKPAVFDPFIQAVEQARQQTPVTVDELRELEAGARLNALIFENEGGWLAPILLHEVNDTRGIKKLDREEGDVLVKYLHLKQESTAVVTRAIDRVLYLLLWGGLVIFVILAISFRSLLRPLRVLGPTIGSVLMVSALLVAFNTPLSLFHFMSLLLVIGLGLDYSLFFNRLTEHHDEWSTTFKALWICCVTTILVFGLLTFSNTPPLQAIGLTVACGAVLCLLLGAIFSSASASMWQRP